MNSLDTRRELSKDRRQKVAKTALYACFKKRRRNARRDTDSLANTYVDYHEPKVMYLALGAMLLSVLDAFFTSILIQHGSRELNPLLAPLLSSNVYFFFLIKFVLTGVSVLLLVLHKYHLLFNRISGYQILVCSFIFYALLIAYEISMIRHISLLT